MQYSNNLNITRFEVFFQLFTRVMSPNVLLHQKKTILMLKPSWIC